jgi:ketosteroid isomerase-like protein
MSEQSRRPEENEVMQRLAQQVSTALSSADLSAFRDLLDPDVRWGAPGARSPACKNRDQVLTWYQRGRDSGTRAEVTETVVHGDKILVGLRVRGPRAADAPHGSGGCDGRDGRDGPDDGVPRWQVLTVRGGRIVDIVGFDDRSEAVTRAGATSA